jgi:hypothetical protein
VSWGGAAGALYHMIRSDPNAKQFWWEVKATFSDCSLPSGIWLLVLGTVLLVLDQYHLSDPVFVNFTVRRNFWI